MTMAEAQGKSTTTDIMCTSTVQRDTQHYGKGDRQILGAPGSVRPAERPALDSVRGQVLSSKVEITNWTLVEWFLQRCDNRKNYI